MRVYLALFLLLAAVMLVTPALAMLPTQADTPQPAAQEKADSSTQSKESAKDTGEGFRVLLKESGKVVTLTEKAYIVGAVCAEMPPLYHEEALKAQAAACYTYAYKMRAQQRSAPDSALKGADISDQSDSHQAYLPAETLKKKWGDNYDRYISRVESAVDEVLGNVICYEGEPITAAFHAICAGQTESAKVMWGKDISYLQPVVSTGDKLSPDYSSSLILTQDQFKAKAAALEGAVLEGDATKWVGSAKTSDSKTVTAIQIGGKEYAGDKVRSAFGLRSACFTLIYKDGSFIFNVSGYGHGVGMSQYGADYMARQGSSWKEILLHYYKGVEIKKL